MGLRLGGDPLLCHGGPVDNQKMSIATRPCTSPSRNSISITRTMTSTIFAFRSDSVRMTNHSGSCTSPMNSSYRPIDVMIKTVPTRYRSRTCRSAITVSSPCHADVRTRSSMKSTVMTIARPNVATACAAIPMTATITKYRRFPTSRAIGGEVSLGSVALMIDARASGRAVSARSSGVGSELGVSMAAAAQTA